jgi:16S rRNA processing protein RimM
MTQQGKLILVGVVLSAHGIKGEVVLKSFTEKPLDIFGLKVVDQSYLPIKINRTANHKNGFICRINNITNRNDAELLSGHQIFCLRSDLPNIEEEEDVFYYEDLKDLAILSNQNIQIGRVISVVNYGGGDVLKISLFAEVGENSEKTLFLPFTKEIFPKVTKDHIIMADIVI